MDEYPMPPAPKKARRSTKVSCGHLREEDAWAVSLQSCGESRLSRELGAKVFCIDFGQKRPKPSALIRWGCPAAARQSPEAHAAFNLCNPAQVRGIYGRENGCVYYCARDIGCSNSAAWLLNSAGSSAAAYSRMPLLATPSERIIPFPPGDNRIVFQAGEPNSKGVDPVDGLAEIALDLALELGLIQTGAKMYSAFQFRGLVWSVPAQQTGLVKGMCLINPSLHGCVVFPASCIKIRSEAALPAEAYGLDVTKDTAGRLQMPMLTTSLLAVLKFRLACLPDAEKRASLGARLRAWVAECRNGTEAAMPCIAWNIERACQQPASHCLGVKLAPRKFDSWTLRRVPVHACKVKFAETPVVPTGLAVLLQEATERDAHTLQRGTRSALRLGANRLKRLHEAHARSPRLAFIEFACTGFALSDFTEVLADKQCYLISGGRSYTGKVAVYRYPMQLPTDIEVWEALPAPATVPWPNNSCIISRAGYVSSRLASGDLDGDLNNFCFDSSLVAFLEDTEESVAAFPISELAASVDSLIPEPAKPWLRLGAKARASEFVHYCVSEVKTPPLRGKTCVLAERVTQRAIEFIGKCDEAALREALHDAIRVAALSHLAMDCPKKKNSDDVSGLAARLAREFDATSFARSSAVAGREMHLALEHKPSSRRYFEKFGPLLEEAVAGYALGRIWCPRPHIFLGREAGELVAQYWLAMRNGTPYGRRGFVRTPLFEIAHLLAHRVARTAGKPAQCVREHRMDAIEAALKRCRACELSSLRSLYESWLV